MIYVFVCWQCRPNAQGTVMVVLEVVLVVSVLVQVVVVVVWCAWW